MARKIPTTVITGFLGAGKTTLIRHMLKNANGRRIALIINEFGDLGVDGDILTGCGDATCTADDITELANGCICCTVADEFIPTMEKLLSRPDKPDHIVIETSGLALPQPLVRAFSWPAISTKVTVDGVISVVDGKAVAEGTFAANPKAIDARRQADEMLDHDTPLSELFEDQLACADMILVNKADLLSASEAADVIETVKRDARAGVPVIATTNGVLAGEVLLGLNAAAETDMTPRAAPHHDGNEGEHNHDEFESFVVTCKEITDPEAFKATIRDVICQHDILRLKGFATVAGKPMRLTLQAVGPRLDSYFDRPIQAGDPRETRLVVIGEHGLDRAAINAALSA